MDTLRRFTVFQTAAVLMSTIIGVGGLAIPRFAVKAADTGGPLLTLLSVIVAAVGLGLLIGLGMRFPERTIFQYAEAVLGKWPGRIGNLSVLLFFAALTALNAREFGEAIVSSLLERTPLEVAILVMLLLTAIPARYDINTFVYIHQFYIPFILVPSLVLIALSLRNADLRFLQPIWGNEPEGMWEGTLLIATLFQGSFIITLLIPFLRRPEKAWKAGLWGLAVAGGVYTLTVGAVLGVFGSEQVKQFLWPTLELARVTALPEAVLERLDALFLIIWVTAVFTTLFSCYYLTLHGISQMFRLRDHQVLSWFLLPFIFAVAMLPRNVLELYQIVEWVGKIGLIPTIAYPGVLLLAAMIRGKRGERHV